MTSDMVMNKEQIGIIKGLIAYSAKSELILEEIYSSGILRQLQDQTNIDTILEELIRRFSKLPTFFPPSEEIVKPIVTELRFIDLLCNLVAISSPQVLANLSRGFMEKFLQLSVQPTICECFEEEMANYTSYLQLICENVTNSSLVANVFEFILSPKIITVFLKRLRETNYATKKPIALVSTLRLFKVLLEFYCEDFWYEVLISHLASQNHLIKYQRGVALPEINMVDSTLRFLSLIPTSVLETMGIDLGTYYMEYSFQEISRLNDVDTAVLQTAAKKYFHHDLTKLNISNQNYPLWKYKYDGTDNYTEDVSDDEEYKTEYYNNEPYTATSTTEEELDGDDDRISSSCDSSNNPLNSTLVPEENDEENGNDTPESERDLLSIVLNDDNIRDKSIKRVISVDPTIATLDWDLDLSTTREMVIMDDEKPSTSQAAILKMQQEHNSSKTIVAAATLGTFGPLVDCLMDLLQNWCILDMETLLVATEIVSIMASSRIPLVTSILLDTQLILQPSFPSFQRILNTIRVHLEALLQSYPTVLEDTWEMLQKHENYPGRSLKTFIESSLMQQGRSNSNSSLVSTMSTDSRISVSSIMSNFGQKVRASTPFLLAKNQIDKIKRANTGNNGRTNRESINMFQMDPQRNQEQTEADKKELETARLIGLRTLLFSQWLMELGAIAQQTSWSVPVRGI